MATGTSSYSPLPGTWIAAGTRVWLAEDHILLQRRSVCIESYRRFYLPDIQAFLVRETPDGRVWNVLLAGGIGLMLLIAVVMGAFPPALLVACGVLLVVLLLNLWMGPTCRFHIRTAVSLRPMPMLSRLRTAEKFLRVLVPVVRAAQGSMLPEEVRQQALESHESASSASARARAPAAGVVRAIRHYEGTMHAALFAVLLAGFALSAIEYLQHTTLVAVFLGLVLVSQAGFAIAAAVKQSGTDAPAGLKATVWLGVTYVCVVFLLVVVFAVSASDYDADFDPAPAPHFAPYAAFIAVCSGVLGLLGVVLLAKFRGAYRRRLAAEAPVLLERA